MRAGRLDQRITLSIPSKAVYPDGTFTNSWEEVATIWATVVSPSQSIRFGAPMPMPVETFTVWIRHRDIQPEMRVTWNNNHYRITGISYHGRKESIALTIQREDVQ